MVLPFVSIIHAIVALVAIVPYTVFPVARELVRIQFGYYAMDPLHTPTPWSQLVKISQPSNINNTYAPPPPIQLQYSPISIWEAPPPPRPPRTCPTSTPSLAPLDTIVPTTTPPIESTPALALEAPSFAPAVRTAPRSAKQQLPTVETVEAIIHVVEVIQTLFGYILFLWACGSIFLPGVLACVVLWAQRTILYLRYQVCYRFSLFVTAIGRHFVPQIVWDVVAYRAAIRRERMRMVRL